jgi:acyl carrier protein
VSTEREALRLQDIIDNIDRIEGHVVGLDGAKFAADPKSVDAVERCLQRIAEAVIKIGPERMAQISPRTPVDAVRGLGNMLRHDYDKVDLAIIWPACRSCALIASKRASENFSSAPLFRPIPRPLRRQTSGASDPMDRVATNAKIAALLAPFNKKEVEVNDATTFAGDLEFDSLTVMDFVAAIEDEFDIIISMNAQAEIETYGQLVDAVVKLQG